MVSIKSSYQRIKEANSNWGDYVCLAEAVRGKGFSRRKIYLHFRNLVNRNDYRRSEVNQLVRYLTKLSKDPEESTFFKENALKTSFKMEDDITVVF